MFQENNIIEKEDISLFNKEYSDSDQSFLDTLFLVPSPAFPLEKIGVSKAKKRQFESADITNTGDLVNYLPKKYIDYSSPRSPSTFLQGELCSVIGTVIFVKDTGKMVYANCVGSDGDRFMACWFNQPYIAHMLDIGAKYIFCGKVNIAPYGAIQIMPTEFSKDVDSLKRIVPKYKKIKGMSDEYLKNAINSGLELLDRRDHLTVEILKEFNLITKYDFFNKIHNPLSLTDIKRSMERYVFDRLFRFNFIMKKDMADFNRNSDFEIKNISIYKKVIEKLPYKLTPDQESCVKEILRKMQNKERVSGLIQGDVGSGKTIISFLLLVMSKDNNFQGALIAPTEVLAKQHYNDFVDLTDDLGIRSALLTGSTKTKEKNKILKELKNGEIDVVIGTHALIQDSVKYNNLGIVVIDEQHRFGVEQRSTLSNGDKKPHIIIMSATPIPRTLSMAIYGDSIEVFNIKTKPAGRKPVITKKVTNADEAYNFIHNEIKNGKQAYVICPLIDESKSEKMADVESVSEAVKDTKRYFKDFPNVKISSINGKMKQQEIEEEIKKFYNGETDILISTTIVEVGVNVPNASVILIKNSERFGLAQAHQLRGRVGRSEYQSYCLLLAKEGDPKAEILCSSSDGFVIAQEDLKMRGSGDFLGTKQSGYNEDINLMLSFPDLYQRISKLNEKIFENQQLLDFYSIFFKINKK